MGIASGTLRWQINFTLHDRQQIQQRISDGRVAEDREARRRIPWSICPKKKKKKKKKKERKKTLPKIREAPQIA